MPKNIDVNRTLLPLLTQDDRNALQQFLDRNARGLNLEKLECSGSRAPLYTIRSHNLENNNARRLVLTTVKKQNKQHWVLIKILPDHGYELFLKQIKGNKDWVHNRLDDTVALEAILPPEPQDNPELPDTSVIFRPVFAGLHNQSFILLDDLQVATLEKPLPLIISGAPGSGKSSTALEKMKEWCEKNKPEEGQIIYLTSSASLTVEMEEQWKTMQEFDPALKNYSVCFKTIKQIYEEHKARDPEHVFPLIDEGFALSWLTDHLTTEVKRIKTAPKPADPNLGALQNMAKNPDMLYQEFRAVSGYDSFEEYDEATGIRYSSFKTQEERRWLFNAYKAYRIHLETKKLTDLNFYSLEQTEPAALVVFDEAQDGSFQQLAAATLLAKNHQIIFNVGDHQQLFGSESIVPFIKLLFFRISKKLGLAEVIDVAEQQLIASYRCPLDVIEVTNHSLSLKCQAIGGKSALHKGDIREVQALDDSEKGSVVCLTEQAQLERYIEQGRNSAHFVVIVPDVALIREEAIGLFGKEHVFTTVEMKGLQRKHVLLYRFFDDPHFDDIDRILAASSVMANPDVSNRVSVHTSKVSGNIRNSLIFNQLFVALTRAEKEIIFYNPKNNRVRHLLGDIFHFVARLNNGQNQQAPAQQIAQSGSDEWRTWLNVLRSQNLNEQAQAIQAKHLQKSESTIVQDDEKGTLITASRYSPPLNRNMPSAEEKSLKPLVDQIFKDNFSVLERLLAHPLAGLGFCATNTCFNKRSESVFMHIVGQTKMPRIIPKALLNIITDPNKFNDKILDFLCCDLDRYGKNSLNVTYPSLLGLFFKELYMVDEKEQLIPALQTKIKGNADLRSKVLIALNSFRSNGYTLAHLCIISSDYLTLSALGELGVNLSQPSQNVKTTGAYPIHLAVTSREIQAIRILAKYGADLNVRYKSSSPFLIAITNDHKDVLEMLRELGANISGANISTSIGGENDNLSAITYTAYMGSVACIELFHQWGVNLEEEDDKQRTAVDVAAQNGQFNMLKKLAEYGASLRSDHLVLFAKKLVDSMLEGKEEDKKSARKQLFILYKLGLDFHYIAHPGMGSILYYAVSKKNIALLRDFKKWGIDLEAPNSNEFNVVLDAVVDNDIDALKMLCELGANLQMNDPKYCSTPAIIAVIKDHLNVLDFLKEHGVDLSVSDTDGETPALAAVLLNNIHSIEKLYELKVDFTQDKKALLATIVLGHTDILIFFIAQKVYPKGVVEFTISDFRLILDSLDENSINDKKIEKIKQFIDLYANQETVSIRLHELAEIFGNDGETIEHLRRYDNSNIVMPSETYRFFYAQPTSIADDAVIELCSIALD